MITFPNAKINLGLNIVEKRKDGFHNIESCFYPVGWTEALEINSSKSQSFHSYGLLIPPNNNGNLCEQAYNLLKRDYQLPPVSVHLLKNIPIGAGLGGGSADGAFMLKLLNDYYKLGISPERLMEYAAQLGSDCPFFIQNKPVLAIEKGTVLLPVKVNLSGLHIIIIYPDLHISTAEAYANVSPKKHTIAVREIVEEYPLNRWKDLLKNDFEESLFPSYPILSDIKKNLYEQGAIYASMTGSGSAIFGIFNEIPGNPYPKFEHFIGKMW